MIPPRQTGQPAHEILLHIPLESGATLFLSPPASARTPSDLLDTIRSAQTPPLPPWGTFHALFRSPLAPDNRTFLFSIAFTSTHRPEIIGTLASGFLFKTPAQAALALETAPRIPTSFWLPVRKPHLFPDISQWNLTNLPTHPEIINPWPLAVAGIAPSVSSAKPGACAEP